MVGNCTIFSTKIRRLHKTLIVSFKKFNNMVPVFLWREWIFISIVILLTVKMMFKITIVSIDEFLPITHKIGFIE